MRRFVTIVALVLLASASTVACARITTVTLSVSGMT